jgi:aminoglycoside phosphotransferase (APT) family kinase protein
VSGAPPALAARFAGRIGARIGHGGQATVYELDHDKVLRVYRGAYDGIEPLASYYAALDRSAVSFAVPEIIEHGEIDGQAYTIDRRLSGRPLIDVLPELTGEDRRRALDSYIDAAHQLARLSPGATETGAWRRFLHTETDRQLAQLRGQLEKDLPRFVVVAAALYERIDALPEPASSGLVHGDYFPGNVLIGDDLAVSAVIDFDLMPSAGDPMMDITGGAFFLEVQRRFDPDDAGYVFGRLEERHGRRVREIAETYRRWYAVHFAHSKGIDERLYAWCIRTLSRPA